MEDQVQQAKLPVYGRERTVMCIDRNPKAVHSAEVSKWRTGIWSQPEQSPRCKSLEGLPLSPLPDQAEAFQVWLDNKINIITGSLVSNYSVSRNKQIRNPNHHIPAYTHTPCLQSFR